jgi:hypothetical protein
MTYFIQSPLLTPTLKFEAAETLAIKPKQSNKTIISASNFSI